MGRLCSWCGELLRVGDDPTAEISHALCVDCLEDLEDGLAENGLRVAGAAIAARPSS